MASYVKRHVRKPGAERRQEILDATLEIISEHGLEGATVARIAAAVGLTPGALYRHFQSRGALIAEANKLANERALDWVRSSCDEDVFRRLEKIGEAHAAWSRQHFATVVRPFFLELASTPAVDPEERLILGTFKSFQALVDLAEEGKRRGVVRSDVRAEDVAWALHMAAWAEDVALMAGAEEYVDDGTFTRNLRRMLASFRAAGPSPDEPEPEPGPDAPEPEPPA